MNRDSLLRRALWTAAAFNIGGALLFGFPGSAVAHLAGLPSEVPVPYRALLAMFILLFGGAYAWVARQAVIDRSLVAFGAIGKASAFAIVSVLWLLGDVPARCVALMSGDLALAAIFAWGLLRP